MSDTAQEGSPQPAQATPAAHYQTLAALRQAHQLLRQRSAEAPQAAEASAADAIRTFLAEARRTGVYLADPKERRAAQGILDYWNAELLTLPGAGSMDFAPSLLEPCDPSLSADPASAPAPTDQSGLIRFTAFARQWQAAGRPMGYLLTGGAIEQAKQFWGVDSDLDAFIRASAVQERAVKAREDRKKYFWLGALVSTAAVAAVVGAWYGSLEPTAKTYIDSLQSNPQKQIEALEFLNNRQRFLAPYDLSGLPFPLKGVKLSGPLDLKAPNFNWDHFEGVSFRDAKLVGASFVGSNFSFRSGAAGNDAKSALLKQAQFRGAKIASTSFEGAGLYGAVFDRAALCGTNFAGADLRRASFWGASIDAKTKESLRQTAWYLAEGLSWELIEDFAAWNGEDAAWKSSIKASKGFREDIGRGLDSYAKAGTDSVAQALALADIAWTRATWGIDVASVDRTTEDGAAAQNTARVPPTALDAADRALAVVDTLTSLPGDARTSVYANILDTKAYVLLQSGRAADAVKVFEQIRARAPQGANADATLGSSDSLFRYAIAQYAAGADKTVWMATLTAALKRGYQPTHELHSLKTLIFRQPEIESAIGDATMRRWPRPEISGRDCPAP